MSQIDSLQQDLSGENERAREVEEGLSMRLDELPQGMKEQVCRLLSFSGAWLPCLDEFPQGMKGLISYTLTLPC